MSKNEGQPGVSIRSAWLRWILLCIALVATIMIASLWVEFKVIAAVLLAVLAGVLLYQRYVNKRSWRSIMWGIHARDG